jgi:hypothetical protein
MKKIIIIFMLGVFITLVGANVIAKPTKYLAEEKEPVIIPTSISINI